MTMTAVKERPVIFSGPMICAILEGRKTQTRRLCKDQTAKSYGWVEWCPLIPLNKDCMPYIGWCRDHSFMPGFQRVQCPYGRPVDQLFVREGWRFYGRERVGVEGGFEYRSDLKQRSFSDFPEPRRIWDNFKKDWDRGLVNKWRSPLHMPRWASRITLEITEIKVERLNEISPEDCFAEGLDDPDGKIGWAPSAAPTHFAKLWDKINGKTHPWKSNPWVWVITFRKVSP